MGSVYYIAMRETEINGNTIVKTIRREWNLINVHGGTDKYRWDTDSEHGKLLHREWSDETSRYLSEYDVIANRVQIFDPPVIHCRTPCGLMNGTVINPSSVYALPNRPDSYLPTPKNTDRRDVVHTGMLGTSPITIVDVYGGTDSNYLERIYYVSKSSELLVRLKERLFKNGSLTKELDDYVQAYQVLAAGRADMHIFHPVFPPGTIVTTGPPTPTRLP
jgi:hypothetical protein